MDADFLKSTPHRRIRPQTSHFIVMLERYLEIEIFLTIESEGYLKHCWSNSFLCCRINRSLNRKRNRWKTLAFFSGMMLSVLIRASRSARGIRPLEDEERCVFGNGVAV